MTHPVGYRQAHSRQHPDATILDRIQEQFGPRLENLTRDDKAAVLICLVERATNTQQVFIEDNFFTNQNGGQLWHLAQGLSPANQLALSLTILEQITYGGQR
jgi:hypothetical protein